MINNIKDAFFFVLRTLRLPAFWALSLLSTFGMNGLAVAQSAAGSQAQPSTGSSVVSTGVQRQQLLLLQSHAADEINRRLGPLNDILNDLQHAGSLPQPVLQAITDEVTAETKALVAIRDKIAADSDLPTAEADAQKIDQEYPLYLLADRKGYLLVTTDFQMSLEAKLGQMATKMQTRLTTANNNGKDVSQAQVALNDLRSHLQTAQQQTQIVAAAVPPIQPGTYETNTAVMQSYQDHLQRAHKEDNYAYNDANQIANAIASQNL